MAKQIITKLLDDLDGGDAAETITFALDGNEYSIDLSEVHAKELRAVFDPYVEAGQRIRSSSRPVVKAPTDRIENWKIREWAKANNWPINDRGRIPQNVVDAYRAAV